MFLRHIPKMPQYFLEPAMLLAMAASSSYDNMGKLWLWRNP
jgi:hypothetical protein